MKKLIYTLIAAIALSSCGDQAPSVEDLISQGDLSALRAKKK